MEERGAVFTRREVVNFILDLTGYTADKPLHTLRALEPCFGAGDFLLPVVERLLNAYHQHGRRGTQDFAHLTAALRAVELHKTTFLATRQKLSQVLDHDGFSADECEALLEAWLVNGDFLLESLEAGFTFVVGNPPYIRQERIPDVLLTEYRRRYATIFDRADIYIPFIERSLALLTPGGALGFICADRWMKNRYGGPLRQMVADGYRLKFYVDMVNTPAFLSEVAAYPAIIILSREKNGSTRIAHRPAINTDALSTLARMMTEERELKGVAVKEIGGVVQGEAPWILESTDQIAIVRRLERDFPTLEDAGCRVGIGVATGADKVFIGPFDGLDVEPDRKLPLAMTRDIVKGTVKWRGLGVINPFQEDGTLVSLAEYPRLAVYLAQHSASIKARHVAKRTPSAWYRTIDRITPSLASTPKLLIPDIKGAAHIVYEEGRLYPHHNLYFITSDEWDLQALRAVLMSGIARLFVVTYSTRMRGGYLRFQAQYLRRIRLPRWDDVAPTIRTALVKAAEKGNVAACNAATFEMYGLTKMERIALGGNGEGERHGDQLGKL
ncbi:MAG: Eco57I restriction-modification methylase domain-containing protein [Candidatus Binatia bacterium]